MRKIKDECFECGSTGSLHDHHVVPRVIGGSKTIKLCEHCHGKIHGLDFTDHSILVKKGIEDAKRRGVRLGRPTGILRSSVFLKKHLDIIECLKKNMSVRKTATYTNKGGSTVQRVKKILEYEKNKV